MTSTPINLHHHPLLAGAGRDRRLDRLALPAAALALAQAGGPAARLALPPLPTPRSGQPATAAAARRGLRGPPASFPQAKPPPSGQPAQGRWLASAGPRRGIPDPRRPLTPWVPSRQGATCGSAAARRWPVFFRFKNRLRCAVRVQKPPKCPISGSQFLPLR